MEIVVHSKKSLLQQKFKKKLFHFNRNSQFKGVILKMIQLDIWSRSRTFVSVFVPLQHGIPLPMGVGRGGRGTLDPLDLENLSKTGCFLNFDWEKANFTTFGPPWKNPSCTPLEKIFLTPIIPPTNYLTVKRCV